MKTTIKELNERIAKLRKQLEFINPDTDEAVSLGGELSDLEIKVDVLTDIE